MGRPGRGHAGAKSLSCFLVNACSKSGQGSRHPGTEKKWSENGRLTPVFVAERAGWRLSAYRELRLARFILAVSFRYNRPSKRQV